SARWSSPITPPCSTGPCSAPSCRGGRSSRSTLSSPRGGGPVRSSWSPTRSLATKTLIRAVQADRQCVIFPEGRITVTGALMKIYEGPGMIADKADAQILPVRIDAAQYTPFSHLRGQVRLRWFAKVVITIQPPRGLVVAAELRGRARRQAIGLTLYDLMTNLVFETCDFHKTLF